MATIATLGKPADVLSDRQTANRLRKLEEIRMESARLLAEAKAIREEIQAKYLCGRDSVETESFKVYVTPYDSARVDSKRLKKEQPDVYARYLTVTHAERFGYSFK